VGVPAGFLNPFQEHRRSDNRRSTGALHCHAPGVRWRWGWRCGAGRQVILPGVWAPVVKSQKGDQMIRINLLQPGGQEEEMGQKQLVLFGSSS